MRRKGLWLSVLATALMAGSASAATESIRTDISPEFGTSGWGLDWGTYNETGSAEFLHNSVSLSNTAYRWIPGNSDSPTDATGDSWTPNAGGGQNYDAEAMFYYFDSSNNALHLGLITGFNPFGEDGDSYSNRYYAGDLFVGFGTSSRYQLALGTALGSPSALAGASNLEGATRAGRAWFDANVFDTEWGPGNPLAPGLKPVEHDGIPNGTPNFSQSNPYRVDENNSTVGVYSTGVDYAYTRLRNGGSADPTGVNGAPRGGSTLGNNNNERWFYEYRILLDPNHSGIGGLLENLTAPQGGGIGLHWTMGCGNDYISYTDNRAFPPTVVPVPAAAPMGLLGMGLLALVRRVRRRPEC